MLFGWVKMKKILLVTTPSGFFAQSKMPWSSLDINVIKKELEVFKYQVEIVTFDYLKDNVNEIKKNIIIYTSSQRTEHKRYIEDIMYLFKDDNMLIPNYDALKSHDNKGFQYLLDKKFNLGLIPSDYLCDVSEYRQAEITFPCVYKPANGASATGVKIVNDYQDLVSKSINNLDFSLHDLKKNIKKHIFKSRYNEQWEEYLDFAKQRFVLQKFLPDLKYDYKVLIFGDKYFVLQRFTAENDFRASGSGLHSREFNDEVYKILDKAQDFKCKLPSHIYSLDLCIYKNEAYVIEFQMTHVGPVTLSESDFYYIYRDKWIKIEEKSNLECEFSTAVLGYINENSTFCS